MGIMTKKQKSLIMDMEFKLGAIYKTPLAGPTLASRFIARHIEALREYNTVTNFQVPPTGKQDRYIRVIEQELDVCFTGTTLKEACEFIGIHVGDFKLTKTQIYI
jgi:hypothetical protein